MEHLAAVHSQDQISYSFILPQREERKVHLWDFLGILFHCIKRCRHKVLTNVLFLLFQAQPPPTGRYCLALVIVVGVTLILVITGVFSYRHLSGLRVSTLIV